MLKPESIFRRPPQALNISLRRLLSALGYAYDAAELHHARLAAAARDFFKPGLHPSFVDLQPEQRAGMICDAWSCLDWMHRIRQLIKRLPFGEPRPIFVDQFLDELDAARLLRNRLHHFDEDYASGENCEMGHPILGTLSWIDSRYSGGFIYAFIASGPTLEGGQISNLFMPGKDDLPAEIGNFSLLAFDRSISLSKLLAKIREFMDAFEPLARSSIAKSLRVAATEKGVPFEIVGRYAPCDMITAMAFDANGNQWNWNTTKSYGRVEVPLGSIDFGEYENDA